MSSRGTPRDLGVSWLPRSLGVPRDDTASDDLAIDKGAPPRASGSNERSRQLSILWSGVRVDGGGSSALRRAIDRMPAVQRVIRGSGKRRARATAEGAGCGGDAATHPATAC